MGSAIAINFLYAGLPVLLLDKDDKSLEHGVRLVRKQLDTAVSKGRLTAEAVNEKLGLLTASLDYSGLRDVDLVVESGYEDMAVKEEIFRKLDGICKAGAILASNTSTLDLDRIGGQTRRPPDVIGMHFFAPADRMRLLEIIRTKETAADVLATTMDLSRRLKKTGVVVGVCFGFVGNRMFLPYLREAQLMALEGVSPAYIDRIACDWGMAMGPFAVMDLSGLDVFYRIYEPFGDTPNRYCYFPLANVLFHRGKLGRKSGTGFYQYDGDEPVINPELDGILHSEAERHGIAGRQIDDDEIIGRLLFSMVNEGAMILEEGIALRPGDIDVIFVHGFGFPRYRGGPMCYADTVGTRNVYKTICDYRDRYGDQLWTPAGLLGDLAGLGEAFSET
jgi:3-hydroxyacyl-CoA dehydrogenase